MWQRWLGCIGFLVVCGCGGSGAEEVVRETLTEPAAEGTVRIRAEVWGDNWFAFYSGDALVKEDSVPITTERSFNAEVFEFDAQYPLNLAFVAKDFKENDTGLEYIGSRRQQMGDGGIIAQFTDVVTGKLIAVTNSTWQAFVTHRAPLDEGCVELSNPVAGEGPCGYESFEEPKGWKTGESAGDAWVNAMEHSVAAVRPKGGYDGISWDSEAKIIWSGDLEKDNTVLLRTRIESAP